MLKKSGMFYSFSPLPAGASWPNQRKGGSWCRISAGAFLQLGRDVTRLDLSAAKIGFLPPLHLTFLSNWHLVLVANVEIVNNQNVSHQDAQMQIAIYDVANTDKKCDYLAPTSRVHVFFFA